MALKHKDLISIHDLEIGEVALILDVAAKLKRKQKNGEPHQYLKVTLRCFHVRLIQVLPIYNQR